MKLNNTYAALAALVLATCGDDAIVPETATPGIQVIAAVVTNDTIDAAAGQLRVRLTGSDGKAVQGASIRFAASAVNSSNGSQPSMFIRTGGVLTGEIMTTTGSNGEAQVEIVFGQVAGQGSIVVSAPNSGHTAAIQYEIRPGNAVRLIVTPRDTALFLGASYNLAAAPADRRNNLRNETVEVRQGSSNLRVTGTSIQADVIGRGYTIVQSASRADTAWVTVVPAGALAGLTIPNFDTIEIMNLDGSSRRRIPSTIGGLRWPVWLSNGGLAAVAFGQHNGIHRIAINGGTEPLFTAALGGASSLQVASDRQALYYSWAECNLIYVAFVLRLADKSRQQLSPDEDQCTGVSDSFASPSPDQSTIVVSSQARGSNTRVLTTIDLATRVRTSLGITADQVVWSPTKNLIAYWSAGTLNVATAGGAEQRRVSPAVAQYDRYFNWTEDGEWLIATREDGGEFYVELIRVADGMTLPLKFARLAEPVHRSTPL